MNLPSSKNWKTVSLSELAVFSNGKSSPIRSEIGLYPVYGANGIIGFSNKKNSGKSSIIIGRVGSYCGSLYFSTSESWVTDNAIICMAKENSDSKFIFYLLRTLNLNGRAAGSGQPLINQSILSSIEVSVPPDIKDQRSVTTLLGSLDDKIELLLTQNGTLEHTAQTIFKEWFVDFHFLGASSEMVDSESGKIPKGWRVVKLGEVCEIDPKEKIFKNQSYLFFDMKALSDNSMHISDGVYRKVSSGSVFRRNDILLAKITPCLENGKTGFVFDINNELNARGSTEFIVMRSKEDMSPYYIYCLARSQHFRDTAIKSMSGTSGRQRVQISQIKEYPLFTNKEVVQAFHSVAAPLFNKIRNNYDEVRSLIKIRSELLSSIFN